MRGSSTAVNPAAYSGGTFAIRPPNYTAYYMRAMMHQQAKQQALSQYYDKLQNNINPAGVRSQDLQGWNQKVSAWDQYGIQNRDALVNPKLDGGKAQLHFQMMHSDLLSDMDKSKRAGQNELNAGKLYSTLQQKGRQTNQDMRIIHSMGKSIYDPDFYKEDGVTPHDPTELSAAAPPFDINKQRALATMITRGLKPDRTYGKPQQQNYGAGTEILPYTEKHSTANLNAIAQRTGDAYDSDPSIQGHYDNKVLKPDELDQLRSAYKSVYPKDDILNSDSSVDHRKVAMAEAINDNSQVRNGQELHNVPRIPQGRQMTQEQQKQQYMMGWVNQMASAMKNGDNDEVNRLGAALNAGTNKNSSYLGFQQGNIGSVLPGVNQKPGFMLKHVDNIYDPTTQTTKQTMNQDEFDPNDPALIPKLAGSYQKLMGVSPPLKSGVLSQTLNPGTQPKPTVQMPHGALDDLK